MMDEEDVKNEQEMENEQEKLSSNAATASAVADFFWKGCPNHNLQHDTSQKSPTVTIVTVRPSMYKDGFASLWLLAAVKGVETH